MKLDTVRHFPGNGYTERFEGPEEERPQGLVHLGEALPMSAGGHPGVGARLKSSIVGDKDTRCWPVRGGTASTLARAGNHALT